MQELLTLIGKQDSWENNVPVNCVEAKKLLSLVYTDQWKLEMNNKPKLRVYREMKQDIRVSAHVRANLNRWEKSLLSRMATGVLPLRIESGRFEGLPPEERTCLLCKRSPETEVHFVTECSVFEPLRMKLMDKLPEVSKLETKEEKYYKLFDFPYTYANYIAEIWEKRQTLLLKDPKDN